MSLYLSVLPHQTRLLPEPIGFRPLQQNTIDCVAWATIHVFSTVLEVGSLRSACWHCHRLEWYTTGDFLFLRLDLFPFISHVLPMKVLIPSWVYHLMVSYEPKHLPEVPPSDTVALAINLNYELELWRQKCSAFSLEPENTRPRTKRSCV